MSEERTPGGSRIYRHDAPAADETQFSPGGDPSLIEAIAEHLDACFGATERQVFHELVSPMIHLDVHLVPPSDIFPAQRLVTSGMAEAPMTVPEGFDETPFAELTMALPQDWPVTGEEWDDERVYWPIGLLKMLGRLPHEYSTFFWYGHTIPNGDPPEPYAEDTGLCCALIGPPLLAPEAFHTLQLRDGRSVRFLAVIPIHEDEMRFKLEKGTDALFDLFDQHGLTDVVDPSRPSIVPPKRRFLGR